MNQHSVIDDECHLPTFFLIGGFGMLGDVSSIIVFIFSFFLFLLIVLISSGGDTTEASNKCEKSSSNASAEPVCCIAQKRIEMNEQLID